ncbi:MAG TPA: hypothetical protein DEW46_17850 [Verrucomicrobia bacterium]|jgi:hypothetical protein|nr:hypothetical protein [Verrucomicrobiota bacterium]
MMEELLSPACWVLTWPRMMLLVVVAHLFFGGVSRLLLLQRHRIRLGLFLGWCLLITLALFELWAIQLKPGLEPGWADGLGWGILLLLIGYWLEYCWLRRGRVGELVSETWVEPVGGLEKLHDAPMPTDWNCEAGAIRLDRRRQPVETTFDLGIRRIRLGLPGFPVGPEPFRLLLMSDFHFSPSMPVEYIRCCVDRALALRPDLILLPGDFAACEGVDVGRFLPELARLRAPLGVHGVMGNHDYGRGLEGLVQDLEAAGVGMLMDSWRGIPFPERPLILLGTQWPWVRDRTLGALAQSAPEGYRILLSHTPDNFSEAVALGVDLMVSGHTHAGQIRLPWVGALTVPCRTGRRFDHGLFRRGRTVMVVTSGIGCYRPQYRMFCPPEMCLMEITRPLENGIQE